MESTLSTTPSQISTLESNQIVSGQAVDNTLQLNQQGGGRIDIPLPESYNVVDITDNPIQLEYNKSITDSNQNTYFLMEYILNEPGPIGTDGVSLFTSRYTIFVKKYIASNNAYVLYSVADIIRGSNIGFDIVDGSYRIEFFATAKFNNVWDATSYPMSARISTVDNIINGITSDTQDMIFLTGLGGSVVNSTDIEIHITRITYYS